MWRMVARSDAARRRRGESIAIMTCRHMVLLLLLLSVEAMAVDSSVMLRHGRKGMAVSVSMSAGMMRLRWKILVR